MNKLRPPRGQRRERLLYDRKSLSQCGERMKRRWTKCELTRPPGPIGRLLLVRVSKVVIPKCCI